MNLATNLFIFYIIYIIVTYITIIFSKKNRVEHQQTNIELEKIRKVPYRDLETQKKFLDLKYPKKEPFKFNFKNILNKLIRIGLFIGVGFSIRYLWATYIDFRLNFLYLIGIMIFLPLLINKILKKYNLHQDDILIYFR
jgi:hypothetical protein